LPYTGDVVVVPLPGLVLEQPEQGDFAENHEAYLSGHGESPGRWYGRGSALLGLDGEASVAGFRRMFEGRHPDTGELLGRPPSGDPPSTSGCG